MFLGAVQLREQTRLELDLQRLRIWMPKRSINVSQRGLATWVPRLSASLHGTVSGFMQRQAEFCTGR